MRSEAVVLGISIALALVGLAFFIFKPDLLQSYASLALIFTLSAVIVYVFYTYRLAEEAWRPSANFAILPLPADPYHFLFLIQNHCKLSLKCWCNLNLSINNQAIPLEGFYGGKTSFNVQPYVTAQGHFDLREYLAIANLNINQMKGLVTNSNVTQQLRMNVQFWYKPHHGGKRVDNVLQPQYFDFQRDILVADV